MNTAEVTDARANQGQRKALSVALERTGAVEVAPGVTVHRPLRDSVSPVPKQPDNAMLAPADFLAMHTASRLLAQVNVKLAQLQTERASIDDDDPAQRRRRLDAIGEVIAEAEHKAALVAKPAARKATLAAFEARCRHLAICQDALALQWADVSAEYEACNHVIDRITGTVRYDPMGWSRQHSKLLAPEPRHRPSGMRTEPDLLGNECLWLASSGRHDLNVRRKVEQLEAEARLALNGAGWPA